MTESCFWDALAGGRKPVLLYGTGNGADKIAAVCESRGIALSGVFASDGFVRDRYFRGMRVRSYADVLAAFGEDIAVLLGFGSARQEVLSFVRELDARHDLYIPEVPLCGGDLFDGAYAAAHRDELAHARALFSDERSRALFDDAVCFRLTGKLSCLADTEPPELTLQPLAGRYETVLDGGAFRGDSAALFSEILRPARIVAVEPDPKNAEKLRRYAAGESRCAVDVVEAALWDREGTLPYAASANRGSGLDAQSRRAKLSEVRAATVSSLFSASRVDFIKLDVEGAEAEAIAGAADVLSRDEPDLAVSLYHRTDDLWRLPAMIAGSLPRHRLYLRRPPCVPMWDLTLYAIRPSE